MVFILPTLVVVGFMHSITFRQGMQDHRIEEELLDYSNEIDQSNNQKSGINIAEMLRFLSLWDKVNEKFGKTIKRRHQEPLSKVTKVRLFYR